MLQAFDREGRGSLTKEELTELMGALLGVPQQSTEELYNTATEDQEQLTEGESQTAKQLLTAHRCAAAGDYRAAC